MKNPVNKTSILIVEDQALMINGLKAMLEQEEDFEVIGFTQKALEAEALTQELLPDVILMDFDFPEKNIDGIKIASRIIENIAKPISIIMLTNYDEYALINEAYRSGIKGYVPKNASMVSLTAAIKAVSEGRFYFDDVFDKIFTPPVAETLQTPSTDSNNKSTSHYPLTKREMEVAMKAATGLSRKEIAEALFISPNTIDTHFKNIFAKLDVNNTTGLISWLVQKGLL